MIEIDSVAGDRPIDAVALAQEGRPVVMRGLVGGWPVVRAAREGRGALAHYLRGMASGQPAPCVFGPPEIGGRFFYRPDLTGFNFARRTASVPEFLDQIERQADKDAPLALAMQSAATDGVLPGFAEANAMPLLPGSVRPRIWIGNRIRVATHYDSNDNIACVVGGRRRFTLFPPDQLANLYVGPLEQTPAGAPVSMVDPDAPDLARYPRFAEAQRHARVAELEPGDAIFIPYLWWHAVDSLDPLSVLVNYWWAESGADGAQLDALLHTILAMRALPPERRTLWRTVFDHFAFAAGGPPAAHLPPEVRGVFGTIDADQQRDLARHIAGAITRRYGN